jgi:hypothetical protein
LTDFRDERGVELLITRGGLRLNGGGGVMKRSEGREKNNETER